MEHICPICNGKKRVIEKCPDGYTECLTCGRKKKHNEFYKYTPQQKEMEYVIKRLIDEKLAEYGLI